MLYPAPSSSSPGYVPAEVTSGRHGRGVTGTFAGIEVGSYKERDLPLLLLLSGRYFSHESTVGRMLYPPVPRELDRWCEILNSRNTGRPRSDDNSLSPVEEENYENNF